MPIYPLKVSAERAKDFYGIEVIAAAPPPAPPVVTPATFNATLPVLQNDPMGTCVATNSPTSWAIATGNGAGNFAISAAGIITVTAAGAANIVAQTYNLTVNATNIDGTSPNVAVSIIVATTLF